MENSFQMCLECHTHIKSVSRAKNRQNIDLNIFASVSKETSQILIIRILGDKKRSIRKNTFPSSRKNGYRKEKEKKGKKKTIIKLFCFHAKAKKKERQ